MARTFLTASSQSLSRTGAALSAVPLSMACWFRPSAVGGVTNQHLMSLTDGEGGALDFFLLRSNAAGGAIAASAATGGVGDASTTVATPSDGVWAHCGAVFASATSRTAYLNGVAATTNTTNVTPVGVNATEIGVLSGLGFASGDIGEAAIWRVALSDFDMYRLTQGISPLKVQPAYLVAYWPIGQGSPEPDRWQGNHPLVVTNAPPISASLPPMVSLPLMAGRARRRRVA